MTTDQLQTKLNVRDLCSKFILIVLLVALSTNFTQIGSQLFNQPLMRLYTKD